MMNWDMARLNSDLQAVVRASGRNAERYVRTTSRRLIKQLAFRCPIAGRAYERRGRARAGFWPAAVALQMSTVYTPEPNAGEGAGIDRTRGTSNPTFIIQNNVPYILEMHARGTAWVDDAVSNVEGRMLRELEQAIQAGCDNRDFAEVFGGSL